MEQRCARGVANMSQVPQVNRSRRTLLYTTKTPISINITRLCVPVTQQSMNAPRTLQNMMSRCCRCSISSNCLYSVSLRSFITSVLSSINFYRLASSCPDFPSKHDGPLSHALAKTTIVSRGQFIQWILSPATVHDAGAASSAGIAATLATLPA